MTPEHRRGCRHVGRASKARRTRRIGAGIWRLPRAGKMISSREMGLVSNKSSIMMSFLTAEIDRWTRMGDRIRLMSSSIETRTLCALEMWRFSWTGEGWYINDTDYTRAVIYMSTLANWDKNSVRLPLGMYYRAHTNRPRRTSKRKRIV